eukprot:3230815-Amphidinium_carterae.1
MSTKPYAVTQAQIFLIIAQAAQGTNVKNFTLERKAGAAWFRSATIAVVRITTAGRRWTCAV